MKVAVIHDWLVTYGGAERVLEQLVQLWPEADLFSMVDFIPVGHRQFILNKPVKTSFIQRLPLAKKYYRHYLPLMPLAVEQFDMSAYDLVISSSHAVAKGVLTGPDQLHICYCYTPMRYAWDLQHQYLEQSGLTKGLKGAFTRYLLHKMRLWDTRTANGVDEFVAISEYIRRRIHKVYRRDALVIYPSVDTQRFKPAEPMVKEDFYLTASRLVPYKKTDLLVQAFNAMPDKKLVVIGDGPEMTKIRNLAKRNVSILGYQEHDVLLDYMQRARAFLFAAEEDFGIVPVEAQACGTPVIAFGRGGAAETVVHGKTGWFFSEQTPTSVQQAVQLFESDFSVNTPVLVRHAEQFSAARFKQQFYDFVQEKYRTFKSKPYI